MKRAAALVAILIMAIASTANADTVLGVATVTDNGNTFVNTGWLTVDGYDWGIDSGPYNTIVQITEWAGTRSIWKRTCLGTMPCRLSAANSA